MFLISELIILLSEEVTSESAEYSDSEESVLALGIGILNAVLNFLLSRVYEWIIVHLVNWENHM